jgi:hypothetical protein
MVVISVVTFMGGESFRSRTIYTRYWAGRVGISWPTPLDTRWPRRAGQVPPPRRGRETGGGGARGPPAAVPAGSAARTHPTESLRRG